MVCPRKIRAGEAGVPLETPRGTHRFHVLVGLHRHFCMALKQHSGPHAMIALSTYLSFDRVFGGDAEREADLPTMRCVERR